jgi:tetratricopeptide (TPR) repeat protein
MMKGLKMARSYSHWLFSRRPLCGVLLASLVIALVANPGNAQVTVEALTGSAVSEVGPHYQDVDDAIKRFFSRDVEGARSLLTAAKKKAPKLAPPEVMLAQLLAATGQGPAARQELERAIKNFPNDPEAYLILADSAFNEGRIAEAGLLFAKASELAAKFSENPKRKENFQMRAYAGLAAVDEQRENWNGAKASLAAWAKLAPTSSLPHVRLARALFQLDDRKGAYAELQAAAKLEPKTQMPEVAMGSFYLQIGDKAQAAKFMAAAAKKGAEDVATNLALANYYMQVNQLSDAESHADAALKIDQTNLEALVTRGILARLQRDYAGAKKWLESAHTQSPSNSAVTNQLALALLEQKDPADQKRAMEFADVNMKVNPNSPDAAATLGWIAYRMGKNPEANRAFSAIMQRNALTPESAYYVANVFKDQNQIREAVGLLESALNNSQTFAYRQEAEALLLELRNKLKNKPATTEAEPETK